jgi:tryptophanyl-tRNA synthetase
MKILTGDRPTGPLHIGHYVGSLQNRLGLQNIHNQYIMIADQQALTDYYDKTDELHDNIYKVLASYLSVGIDPLQSTIFLQSSIPYFAELTLYFMNLVSVARALRNPTVKNELIQKNKEDSVMLGFLNYPISQAADILLLHGQGVPVGEDQLPMIEQTNEIVRSFNFIYKTDYFKECHAMLSSCKRLVGIDGKNKMGKSLGNAIFLGDSEKELYDKVMKMYTDPNHIKVTDPGSVDGNVVFSYLDIFDENKEEVAELKSFYQKGGLGDVVLKKRLFGILNSFLSPIRERYNTYYQNKSYLFDILQAGNKKVFKEARKNILEIKSIMGMMIFDEIT